MLKVFVGNSDKAIIASSCHESLSQALAAYPGSRPAAGLLFSCAGPQDDNGNTDSPGSAGPKSAAGIPSAGYYCNGEFGPLAKESPFMFPGTTFVTLLLGPAKEG
jgi:small ligand-binding sensory domain FIST